MAMSFRAAGLVILVLLGSLGFAEDVTAPRRIRPEAAREHAGQKVLVEFQVNAAKFSQKRNVVFLDSHEDFRDPGTLGVAISEKVLEALKTQRQIEKPAEHYRGKKVRVTGVIVIEDNRPYIKVDEVSQLELIDDAAR